VVPAITYFRTFQHYHRPEELNDRVRNGNVCFLLGKVTGERQGRRRPAGSCLVRGLQFREGHAEHGRRGYWIPGTRYIKEAAVQWHRSVVIGGLVRGGPTTGTLVAARRSEMIRTSCIDKKLSRRKSKWSSIRPLVLVGYSDYSLYTSSLSTWSSSRGLQDRSPTKPDLGDGFALICFQRLSRPYVGYPALPRA
jgi:hypothetical protein